jgi:hypothetical protein
VERVKIVVVEIHSRIFIFTFKIVERVKIVTVIIGNRLLMFVFYIG